MLLVREENYVLMGVKIMCIVKIHDTISHLAIFLENMGYLGKTCWILGQLQMSTE